MKGLYTVVALVMLLTSCGSSDRKAGWDGELLLGYEIGLFRESKRLAGDTIRETINIRSGSGTVDNGRYMVSISGLQWDRGEWSYSCLRVTPHDPVTFEGDGITVKYAGEELRCTEDERRRFDLGTWASIGAWSDGSKGRPVCLRRAVTRFEEVLPANEAAHTPIP